jgi:hypothetical protein
MMPYLAKRGFSDIYGTYWKVGTGGDIPVRIDPAIADPGDAAPPPCRVINPELCSNPPELRGTGRAEVHTGVPIHQEHLTDNLFIFQGIQRA